MTKKNSRKKKSVPMKKRIEAATEASEDRLTELQKEAEGLEKARYEEFQKELTEFLSGWNATLDVQHVFVPRLGPKQAGGK